MITSQFGAVRSGSVPHLASRLAAFITTLFIVFSPGSSLLAQGKIYFVFGSDTGIWESMTVERYNCTYRSALFTDPSRNGYGVMDPAFRGTLRDSYGTPMKLTWWMMCGNIFRYATNTDVPAPNMMTMYLMQRYHGDAVRQWGDELTLHYHTFVWTDYDSDGKFYWNQARDFAESRDDFDVTLAQLLLEEGRFPVSFRSGWHAMDNTWQHYLDELLPYSLHNDWPHKRLTDPEPIDNIFDWSLSPSDFIPFRPSPENYQLPGNGKGWNVRSIHIGSITSPLLTGIFTKAQQGIDQVACFWGHLPEEDFLANLQKVDSLIHATASSYPGVMYRYCTAIEAMQRWRGGSDTTAPVLDVTEQGSGATVSWSISTNESIFQRQPFVAVKDIYERYHVLPCTKSGENQWVTAESVDRSLLAKVGIAVCDTMGNQATHILRYLPDDIYTDDEDPGYQEIRGTWQTVTNAAWGTSARAAALQPGDSAVVRWSLPVTAATRYNLFVQIPPGADAARYTSFRLLKNGIVAASREFEPALPAKSWAYLFTIAMNPGEQPLLEAVMTADAGLSQHAYADVVRCTPLVRDREIAVATSSVNFGEVGLDDTARVYMQIANRGVEALHVLGVSSSSPLLSTTALFPLVVPPMQSVSLPLLFHPEVLGAQIDSLVIMSDDLATPALRLAFSATVLNPFVIADNDDSLAYRESGPWQKSVVQAYGPSSRYVLVSQTSAYARFRVSLRRVGIYDIEEIMPTTLNAADKALYVVSIAGVPIDSLIVDQNVGSGDWVKLGRYYLPSSIPVEVTVCNTGASIAGRVLRADAIKWQLVQEIASVEEQGAELPKQTQLMQNYPNPFNPVTQINYTVGEGEMGRRGDGGRSVSVQLIVYDLLGRAVKTLVNEHQAPGRYTVRFDGTGLASGVYVYRLQTRGLIEARRMMLVK